MPSEVLKETCSKLEDKLDSVIKTIEQLKATWLLSVQIVHLCAWAVMWFNFSDCTRQIPLCRHLRWGFHNYYGIWHFLPFNLKFKFPNAAVDRKCTHWQWYRHDYGNNCFGIFLEKNVML